MMPYVLSTNSLCINDFLYEVTIETLGLHTYIIMKFCPKDGKALNNILWLSTKEENFYKYKLTTYNLVVVFNIPPSCMLAINMIRDNSFDCMSSYMIAKNARFWSFCCVNVFNERSLAAQKSSQALFRYLLSYMIWFSKYFRLALESIYCS